MATATLPTPTVTSVADDLTLLVTRTDTTTSCQCTLVLDPGGNRIDAHRASLARWYGIAPDAVQHVQNTTYTIDLTGSRP